MKIYAKHTSARKSIVEVTGIAGVGKSTVILRVADKLELQKLTISRKWSEPVEFVRSVYRAATVLPDVPFSPRRFRQAIQNTRRAEMMHRLETGIFLVDEGVHHLARKTSERCQDEADLKRSVEAVLKTTEYVPDAVVSLVALPAVIQERRIRRAKPGESCNLGLIQQLMSEYDRQTPVHRFAALARGCRYIEIDVSTAEGFESAVQTVWEVLCQTGRQAPTQTHAASI